MITVDNPQFIDGWQAYYAGLPEAANPFLFQANPYRLWQYGWYSAKLIDLAEQGCLELPGDMMNGELLRIDKSPFKQGQVGYAKYLAENDYPYGPDSQDASDWVEGWRWQQLHRPRFQIEPLQPSRERLPWLAALVAWWRRLRA